MYIFEFKKRLKEETTKLQQKEQQRRHAIWRIKKGSKNINKVIKLIELRLSIKTTVECVLYLSSRKAMIHMYNIFSILLWFIWSGRYVVL